MRTCSIEGCEDKQHGRGWCHQHYRRWWNHGDPLAGRETYGEIQEFYQKTILSYASDECLIWPFYVDPCGYGIVWINKKRSPVNRAVCEHFNGPPASPELHAAHSCGNRACCNHRHLRWATPLENQADRIADDTHLRGERNHKAKLTECDVHKIRHLHGKMTQTAIAQKFGMSLPAINSIIKRRNWYWLPEKNLQSAEYGKDA